MWQFNRWRLQIVRIRRLHA